MWRPTSSSGRQPYSPSTARLTERLVEGDNLVTVKIDGSENPAIPPFGGQIDYLTYGKTPWTGKRFAVVVHLLSITHNWRLRIRCFTTDDDFPSMPSLISVWNSVNWFEREAFDLYGIVFPGHPDLRRILTDYGFIGHPFRKDFPISGYVEMRYDPEQKRVVYEPVSIEPRENTPRIVREENYGDVENA